MLLSSSAVRVLPMKRAGCVLISILVLVSGGVANGIWVILPPVILITGVLCPSNAGQKTLSPHVTAFIWGGPMFTRRHSPPPTPPHTPCTLCIGLNIIHWTSRFGGGNLPRRARRDLRPGFNQPSPTPRLNPAWAVSEWVCKHCGNPPPRPGTVWSGI